MRGRLLGLILVFAGLGAVLVYAQGALGFDGGEAGLALARFQGPVTRSAAGLTLDLQGLTRWRELPEENQRLRAEVARLEAERDRLLALQYENDRLTGLLNLRAQRFEGGFPARVSARDPNLWYSQVVLDRGTRDGVRRNMVAVSPAGLVGKVSSVGNGACRVRLLLDSRLAVPAMLAESGALGVVYGEDGFTCVMKYVGHDVKIREGEAVVTSGLGDVYPGGVPLGRVTRTYGRTEALFQSVQVRPTVDFGALQEALIVEKPPG